MGYIELDSTHTFLRSSRGGASAISQLLLELLNLLLILPEQRVLGVLVNLGLVLDLFGTVGVAQRAEGLVVVVVGRGQTRHHHRFRVTAQRILSREREMKRCSLC